MSVATTDTGAVDQDADSPKPNKAMEIVTALLSLALMTLVLVLSTQIVLRSEASPGQIDARFWPTVLSIAGISLSVAQLVIALVRPAPDREELDVVRRGGYLRVASTLLVTAVFVIVWNIGSVIAFGFRIELFPYAATVYLAALIAIYGARSWKAYVLFPVPMAMLAYLLFSVVLRIPL